MVTDTRVPALEARVHALETRLRLLENNLQLTPDDAPRRDLSTISVDEMELGTRALNILKEHWFRRTVADVAEIPRKELLQTYNCGRITVREIENALARFGVKLKGVK